MLVRRESTYDPTVIQLNASAGAHSKVRSKVRRLAGRLWPTLAPEEHCHTWIPALGIYRTAFRPADLIPYFPAHAVHLGWVADFLDWPTMLPWMASRSKLVWRLADLNPLLGLRHYHPLDDENSESREIQALEEKAAILAGLSRDSLHFVAPSSWMLREIEAHPVASRFDRSQIPTGIDTRMFSAVDRQGARAVLGIPEGSRVVGFVADNISEKRKGLKELANAVESLPEGEVFFLCAGGHGDISLDPDRGLHLGLLTDDRLLAMFYSALDIFVCPSLQENLPNTVMEAMSCGIPCVGFDTGGIPELILNGRTGWLVSPVGSEEGLTGAIMEALNVDESKWRSMSHQCRELIEEKHTLEKQAVAYRDLYLNL